MMHQFIMRKNLRNKKLPKGSSHHQISYENNINQVQQNVKRELTNVLEKFQIQKKD